MGSQPNRRLDDQVVEGLVGVVPQVEERLVLGVEGGEQEVEGRDEGREPEHGEHILGPLRVGLSLLPPGVERQRLELQVHADGGQVRLPHLADLLLLGGAGVVAVGEREACLPGCLEEGSGSVEVGRWEVQAGIEAPNRPGDHPVGPCALTAVEGLGHVVVGEREHEGLTHLRRQAAVVEHPEQVGHRGAADHLDSRHLAEGGVGVEGQVEGVVGFAFADELLGEHRILDQAELRGVDLPVGPPAPIAVVADQGGAASGVVGLDLVRPGAGAVALVEPGGVLEGRVGAHDVHREAGRQDDVERLVHDEIQTIDGVIEVRTYVVTDIKYESSLNIRGVINKSGDSTSDTA